MKHDFKRNVKLNFSTENNTSFPLGNFDKLLLRKKLQTLCVLRNKKKCNIACTCTLPLCKVFGKVLLRSRDAKIPGSFQSFTTGIFWKLQSRDFFIPG